MPTLASGELSILFLKCSISMLGFRQQWWSEDSDMFGRSMGRRLRIFSRFSYVLLIAAIGAAATASAQDRRQNTPGEFDFYVLSLSWSPSFCEGAAERRNSGRSPQAHCGGRAF